jgi:chemotaxis protein methyltransferase CheR
MPRAVLAHEIAWELTAVPNVPTISRDEFELFRALIRKETGISLGDSKRALIVARMANRLRELQLPTYSEYYHHLTKNDPSRDELRRMINCITTNKTSFFREPHHFDFLREQVLPEIQRRVAGGAPRQIRIWSAACSTGEEAYSIAITLREALGYSFSNWDIRILASDIDTDVLSAGHQGMYPQDAAESVPPELRRRMFLRGVGKWDGFLQVRPELRAMVAFRRINFVDSSWPIHARFDVIFCRNVLIYFDRTMQQLLVTRLVERLAPGGYLFSGHSENLVWLTDVVTQVRSTVYRAREGAKR